MRKKANKHNKKNLPTRANKPLEKLFFVWNGTKCKNQSLYLHIVKSKRKALKTREAEETKTSLRQTFDRPKTYITGALSLGANTAIIILFNFQNSISEKVVHKQLQA